MKFHLTIAAFFAASLMPAAITTSHAQEQIVETLICKSNTGSRTSCAVNGEIVSAGIQRQFNEGAPCFLGFTWGFEENGIWTGNGCGAEFAVTVERAAAQPLADPQILRDRLRNTRNQLRAARVEIQKEQESRRVVEAELADALQALRLAEESAPTAVKRKRAPQLAVRSVAACSNRAIRDSGKTGAKKARVAEIFTARPSGGAWLVMGRLVANINGERTNSLFRCWSESGKIVSFDSDI